MSDYPTNARRGKCAATAGSTEPAADDSALEDEDCGDKHDSDLTRAIIGSAKYHAPLSAQPPTSEKGQEVSGHDFSRAEKPRKQRWASAPVYPLFPQAANTAIAGVRCLPDRIEGPP